MTRLIESRAYCPDTEQFETILTPAPRSACDNPFAAALAEKDRADAIFGKDRP